MSVSLFIQKRAAKYIGDTRLSAFIDPSILVSVYI